MARKFKIKDVAKVSKDAIVFTDGVKRGNRVTVIDYLVGHHFPYTVRNRKGKTEIFSARELERVNK